MDAMCSVENCENEAKVTVWETKFLVIKEPATKYDLCRECFEQWYFAPRS